MQPPTPTTPSRRPHLSVSQLNMWKSCGLKWYYRYVLGWIERPKLPLARGKAGHAAVEWNTKQKIAHGTDKPIAEILDLFSDSYDAEVAAIDKADLDSPAEVGRTKDETAETLKIWRAKEAPNVQPLGAEVELELNIPAIEGLDLEVPVVVGRIDEAQALGILDNKFRGRKPSRAQDEVDTSNQLDTYDAFLAQKGIDLPSVGIRTFTPPLKTVPPTVQTVWRERRLMNPEQRKARHERIFHNFRAMWLAIKAGSFHMADDPQTCGYCPYRDRCQSSLVREDLVAIQRRQVSAQKEKQPA